MRSDVLRSDEVERLQVLNSLALRSLGARDPALLSIVRLARRATGCAFAGISIVDAYRQWFAATDGAALPDSPREQSVCARAIQTEAGLVSSDVRNDPRLAPDGPQAIAPGIIFYAGMPIRVGGFAIGALCVIDPVARELTDSDGVHVSLTTAEFDVLLVFCRHPRQIMSRQEILVRTQACSAGPVERSIDVHGSRVRQKSAPN